MGCAIVVTSGRGGAGKSAVSALVATSLAELAQKVAIVDLACGFRTQDYIFASSGQVVFDIADECSGACKIFESGLGVKLRVTLFPASVCMAKDLDKNGFLEFAKMLSECFDYVIYDVPQNDEVALSLASSVCDKMLFVTTPEQVSVMGVASLASRFYDNKIDQRLIINKIPQSPKQLYDYKDLDKVIDDATATLIGAIPFIEDFKLTDIPNLSNRTTLSKISLAIAKRIMGDDVPLIFG